MALSDIEVSAYTAAFLLAVFMLVSFVQARRVPSTRTTLLGETDGTSGMVGFESRLKIRLDTIERAQKDGEAKWAATQHDVNNIRTVLAALPSKDTVHRLEVQLTEVKGSVSTLETVALANQRSTERILNHLMKDSG